jgi:XPG domain containing
MGIRGLETYFRNNNIIGDLVDIRTAANNHAKTHCTSTSTSVDAASSSTAAAAPLSKSGLNSLPAAATATATAAASSDVTTISSNKLCIVVDGSGLSHYIMGQSDIRAVVGGDMLDVQKRTRTFATAFRQCGVQLVIVYDGLAEPIKHLTHVSRDKENIRHQAHALTMMRNNNSLKPARLGPGSTLGSLSPQDIETAKRARFNSAASGLIRHTLREHGAVLIRADGEADCISARVCRDLPAYAILAQDSDFFVLDVPGYIPLQSLNILDNGDIIGTRYTRQHLAGHFSIPCEALPTLACIIPNDFVSHKDLSVFIRRRFGQNSPHSAELIEAAGRYLRKHLTRKAGQSLHKTLFGSATVITSPQVIKFVQARWKFVLDQHDLRNPDASYTYDVFEPCDVSVDLHRNDIKKESETQSNIGALALSTLGLSLRCGDDDESKLLSSVLAPAYCDSLHAFRSCAVSAKSLNIQSWRQHSLGISFAHFAFENADQIWQHFRSILYGVFLHDDIQHHCPGRTQSKSSDTKTQPMTLSPAFAFVPRNVKSALTSQRKNSIASSADDRQHDELIAGLIPRRTPVCGVPIPLLAKVRDQQMPASLRKYMRSNRICDACTVVEKGYCRARRSENGKRHIVPDSRFVQPVLLGVGVSRVQAMSQRERTTTFRRLLLTELTMCHSHLPVRFFTADDASPPVGSLLLGTEHFLFACALRCTCAKLHALHNRSYPPVVINRFIRALILQYVDAVTHGDECMVHDANQCKFVLDVFAMVDIFMQGHTLVSWLNDALCHPFPKMMLHASFQGTLVHSLFAEQAPMDETKCSEWFSGYFGSLPDLQQLANTLGTFAMHHNNTRSQPFAVQIVPCGPPEYTGEQAEWYRRAHHLIHGTAPGMRASVRVRQNRGLFVTPATSNSAQDFDSKSQQPMQSPSPSPGADAGADAGAGSDSNGLMANIFAALSIDSNSSTPVGVSRENSEKKNTSHTKQNKRRTNRQRRNRNRNRNRKKKTKVST